MKIWTVCNQKGGVGKTTTAVTLAGLLSQRQQRTLLVDLDPHGSMSSYFGIDVDDANDSVYRLFADENRALGLLAITQKTLFDGILLLPSSSSLALLDRKMASKPSMGLVIQQALKRVTSTFDFVILDCPPVLGVLMVNALVACEQLIVPVQTEHLALQGLKRMQHTLDMISRAKKIQPPWIIVPTMFDQRTKASINSLSVLQAHYIENLWSGVIPVDTGFRNAATSGVPISLFGNHYKGGIAYEKLLDDLLKRSDRDISKAV